MLKIKEIQNLISLKNVLLIVEHSNPALNGQMNYSRYVVGVSSYMQKDRDNKEYSSKWDLLLNGEKIVGYADLPAPENFQTLDINAVLKLNKVMLFNFGDQYLSGVFKKNLQGKLYIETGFEDIDREGMIEKLISYCEL